MPSSSVPPQPDASDLLDGVGRGLTDEEDGDYNQEESEEVTEPPRLDVGAERVGGQRTGGSRRRCT